MVKDRWAALTIIFASYLQFTLNWFSIIPMFPRLKAEMGLTPLQIGGVASAFVAGYGIAHIPAGIVAERYGMRFAMLSGIALEALGVFMTSTAHAYEILLVARFLCGVGASIYAGSAIGLVAAWFRQYELATANGLITGFAFALGAAIGLFGWGGLADVVGWRTAILAGAAVSVLSFLLLLVAYPRPPVNDIGATTAHQSAASLRRSLTNKRLWIMSVAYLGGYGSYFTAVAMMPGYAVERLQLPPEVGQQLGSILLLSGMIGAFLAGWLADKLLGLLRTFLLASVLEAAALMTIPWISPIYLPWAAAVIGAMVVLAFISWIGLPGLMQETFRASDVPTAAGLMLTIAAVGGVVLPPFHAELTTRIGSGAGWYGLGLVTIIFASIAILDRRAEN